MCSYICVSVYFICSSRGKPMKGVSVFWIRLDKSMISDVKPKMERITDHSHFAFDDKVMKMWKHYGIGEGEVVQERYLKGLRVLVNEQARHTEIGNGDKRLIASGQCGKLWIWRPEATSINEPDDHDDESESPKPDGKKIVSLEPQDLLHYCWCGVRYLRYANLMAHLEWDATRFVLRR